MKKIFLTLLLAISVFSASANSVRYFTRSQAIRVASALDAQSELMIYCGYEYELATYVIINEVWAEPVNSKYYEIWLFGYDAYTGEEIYMPIDLACIWLYNSYTRRIYSAAQYLRFRSSVSTPNFYWTMPPYNNFTRMYHDPMFNHTYTYHYDIHRYGWKPGPMPNGGNAPYHPYYMRTPSTPAPVPTKPFTPGVNHPQTTDGHGYVGNTNRVNNGSATRNTSFGNNGGARSGENRINNGNPGTTNRNNGNVNNSNTRSNGTTNSGNNVRNSGNVNSGNSNVRNSGSSSDNNNSGNNVRNSGNVNSGNSNVRSSGSSSDNKNSGNNVRNSGNVNSGNSNVRSSGSSSDNKNSGNNVRNSGYTNSGNSNTRSSGATNSGNSNTRSSGTTNSEPVKRTR